MSEGTGREGGRERCSLIDSQIACVWTILCWVFETETCNEKKFSTDGVFYPVCSYRNVCIMIRILMC